MRRFAYKLAARLGYVNVDRMLREISWEQLLEWKVFDDLEPFGDERADYRSAHIVQTLWNIHRDAEKCPEGYPITDFLLGFGDRPRPEKVAQTVQYQETILDAWCFMANEKFKGTA